VGDARWLGKIRRAAAAYRDDKIDISDCGAKVRQLIEEAVIAEGIQILVKQVSLFTPEFEEKLKALKSDRGPCERDGARHQERDPRQARGEPCLLHVAP
jgi:hypothetical protein